jgi:hypothetical protein
MIEKMIDSTSELAQWLATREAWDSMADQARAFVLVDAPNQVKGYVKSVNWKMDDPTPKASSSCSLSCIGLSRSSTACLPTSEGG